MGCAKLSVAGCYRIVPTPINKREASGLAREEREQRFAYRNFFCKGRGDETILGVRAKYTVIGECDMSAVKRNYRVYVAQKLGCAASE
jgi:hypothetical protein